MIEAENISKIYRRGMLGSRTLQEDLKNWWNRKILFEETITGIEKARKHHIWALHHISFALAKGEVLGIIGRNGAGKSTLLKIISRITLPTTGRIRGNGRIASLLEIGTGFHRELSGKENIYLYGHIMGMKKKEIAKKFDEIVAFSEMEEFLDEPVKRYSSGTYVRLAFAVAAYLDPEILIIDEVLAVGDAAFQRKCAAKMKEISTTGGKTILFVSHNMQTLKNICNRAMLLDQGQIVDIGEPAAVISAYLKKENTNQLTREFLKMESAPGNDWLRIRKIGLLPDFINNREILDTATPFIIFLEAWLVHEEAPGLVVGIDLFDVNGDCIFELLSVKSTLQQGLFRAETRIPAHFLNSGSYVVSVFVRSDFPLGEYNYAPGMEIHVEDVQEQPDVYGKWKGMVRPDFPVSIQRI